MVITRQNGRYIARHNDLKTEDDVLVVALAKLWALKVLIEMTNEEFEKFLANDVPPRVSLLIRSKFVDFKDVLPEYLIAKWNNQ